MDHGYQAVGIEVGVVGRVQAAEGAARVDALVDDIQLRNALHDLLHVDRIGSPPDLQHGFASLLRELADSDRSDIVLMFDQRISADSATACFSISMSKSAFLQASRTTCLRRTTSSSAPGRLRAAARYDDGPVAVRVDQIATIDGHAEHIHLVDMGMARNDFASQDLESRRQVVKVAERAVGDGAKASKARVIAAVDLPQNAPNPCCGSRSWISASVGPGCWAK